MRREPPWGLAALTTAKNLSRSGFLFRDPHYQE